MLTVTFDAHDTSRLARFWGGLLDRDATGDEFIPATDTQVGLRFAPSHTGKTGPNRMHLHLTSTSEADQQHIVDKARRLGATHLDVGQLPEERHVVLADPEGNEFCVIPPDTAFLAGCGPLGEVACDGSRAVGVFWSEALGWPLVWDQDEETAVQSPNGGTKIAWGGPPVAPKTGRNRQCFRVTPAGGDAEAEAERLIGLGATRLEDDTDGITLADPDGNEFTIARN